MGDKQPAGEERVLEGWGWGWGLDYMNRLEFGRTTIPADRCKR